MLWAWPHLMIAIGVKLWVLPFLMIDNLWVWLLIEIHRIEWEVGGVIGWVWSRGRFL